MTMTKTAPIIVTMYSRPGCHLCDDAKVVLEPLLAEFGASLREINIETDVRLAEQFGYDIPVIFINDRKAAKHRVNPQQFRRQLTEVFNHQ